MGAYPRIEWQLCWGTWRFHGQVPSSRPYKSYQGVDGKIEEGALKEALLHGTDAWLLAGGGLSRLKLAEQ